MEWCVQVLYTCVLVSEGQNTIFPFPSLRAYLLDKKTIYMYLYVLKLNFPQLNS